MGLPFFIFWILLFVGRVELGWRWVLILVGLWVGLLAGLMWSGLPSSAFVAAQALLDAILVVVIFKGDIRIR